MPPGITSRPAAESPITALAASPAVGRTGSADRFAVHSWSQDADDVISEMLAADAPGRHITIVSPAATAIALALHRGYVAIVPRITAASELRAGWLRPVPLPLPRFTARLDCLYLTRHPRREQLDAIGRATRQALRRDQREAPRYPPSTPASAMMPGQEY
jgi:DNA-binding transcriptional LysR family regulator